MSLRRGYLFFASAVTFAYAVVVLSGWEWTNAGTGGPRGPQGFSSYRGGK